MFFGYMIHVEPGRTSLFFTIRLRTSVNWCIYIHVCVSKFFWEWGYVYDIYIYFLTYTLTYRVNDEFRLPVEPLEETMCSNLN